MQEFALQIYFSGGCDRRTPAAGGETPIQHPLRCPSAQSQCPSPTFRLATALDRSASTITPSEKSSIITNRNSSTGFKMSLIWTASVAPKPQRAHKRKVTVFRIKVDLSRKRSMPLVFWHGQRLVQSIVWPTRSPTTHPKLTHPAARSLWDSWATCYEAHSLCSLTMLCLTATQTARRRFRFISWMFATLHAQNIRRVFFSMHRTFVNVRLFHGNDRKTLLLNIKTLLGREVLSCFTGGFYWHTDSSPRPSAVPVKSISVVGTPQSTLYIHYPALLPCIEFSAF